MKDPLMPRPFVQTLPSDFAMETAFEQLCHLPGCLWFDSALGGRYSFITAGPIESLVASLGDPDPWPTLHRWCRELPITPATAESPRQELPPFQGGIAGLIGYEAGYWLEKISPIPQDDLPTPAMSLGIYDWTIAFDHQLGTGYLLCNGLADRSDPQGSAQRRAAEIETLLQAPPATNSPAPRSPATPNQHSIPSGQYPSKHPDVTSNFTGPGFRAAVADIVQRIHRGDSFQVNLAQRLLRRSDLPATELYRRLRASNPAPYGGFYRGDGFEVICSSPESFLCLRDRQVQTRPIKGTAPRMRDPRSNALLAHQLRSSSKDRAENVMIVDLMRNDLSRVCEDESVVVQQLCQIETYRYVQHLVSLVEGRLRDDQTAVDLLAACFPGGSITGAPKIEAMRTIAELEPHRRGPYCGSLGYISTNGDAEFNILIRTITAAHGYWQIPVGGGITARSDPHAEEAETWVKAEGMLRAFATSAIP